MSKKEYIIAESKAHLVQYGGLKTGDTLLVIWRGQSQSETGNNDRYSVHVVTSAHPLNINHLTYHTSRVLGYRYSDRKQTITLGGCGYNKPDAIRSELGFALFGDEKAFRVEEL